MFVEMLLKSGIQCECEKKTPFLYMLYTVGISLRCVHK